MEFDGASVDPRVQRRNRVRRVHAEQRAQFRRDAASIGRVRKQRDATESSTADVLVEQVHEVRPRLGVCPLGILIEDREA